MTLLENKTNVDTKNIILECSSKITFNQVSENIKKITKTINTSYFKREYVFLNVDSFYEYKGKLNKEQHTEQYFIIFFKNKEEFTEMIDNPHIDIEEINKKEIFFIYVIPNTFRTIRDFKRYELFSHLYLEVKEKPKWIKPLNNEKYSDMELISKSGFKSLSEINQVLLLENFSLSKEELSSLQFSGTLSEDVSSYYLKNIYRKQNKGSRLSSFKSKLLTIF